jgi:hypothetical protein
MAGATPTLLSDKSQQGIVQFEKQCYSMLNSQWNIREQMRAVDLSYIRENDWTRTEILARGANRYGDPTKYQNVTVPVVMPQVEAAVTYQSSVFLTGVPLFGWVSPPSSIDSAGQFSAVVEENSIRGAWVQQIMMAFRDGFKYNIGILSPTWDRVVTAAIETDLSFTAGREGKPKSVIWEGNVVKRWDPYNSFWDTRYKPTEIYKNGEFAGTTELMSRVHLKKFINELPDKMISNVAAAFESGMGNSFNGAGGIESYYLPRINPGALMDQDPKRSMDWMAWAGIMERPPGEIKYQNIYEVTTLFARIIPQDFRMKVPSANTPQVWKFIIVNHQILIYAERQTNAHNYLPALFMQPNEDGLAYQTKSLAQNAKPFQDIASALVNSAMAARRRAISDRGIYNPLLVAEKDINNDSPTAKIPMRPAGYNHKPEEAYYAIPFRDDQSAVAFQELPQIMQMANDVNGQNKAKQGQFVKGNKTSHEFDTVMANANGRDQMCAMLLEAQTFTPLKEIIKINTMQFQAGTSIFSPSQKKVVKIDPVALRNSFANYTLTDGLVPSDKVIQGDDFTMAMQTIGSSQQIGSQYNLGPMFSYLMKTRNVDLKDFEKSPTQIAYEQAMGQWQQLAEMAIQKGAQFNTPQPTPQQFGYDPNAQAGTAQPQQTTNSGSPAQTPNPTGMTTGQQSQTQQMIQTAMAQKTANAVVSGGQSGGKS